MRQRRKLAVLAPTGSRLFSAFFIIYIRNATSSLLSAGNNLHDVKIWPQLLANRTLQACTCSLCYSVQYVAAPNPHNPNSKARNAHAGIASLTHDP